MSSVAARKERLIAESELHRAELSNDWRMLAVGAHDLVHRARAVTAWGSAVATLVAGLTAFHHKQVRCVAKRPSWWQRVLGSAELASSIWMAFRTRPT